MDPETLYDILIIGAGPAGLSAALYATRKDLKIGIIGKRKGGQILDTSGIDNYLGLEEITGEQMADRFLQHLNKYGVPILEDAEVANYSLQDQTHHIGLSSGEIYQSKTLIIATGSTPRYLGIPGEKQYAGKGVSYCAICDAPLFIGKNVLVAGGGNAAVTAALDLAKQAASVTLIHRSTLRADKILVKELLNHPKITVLLKTRIQEVTGETVMSGARVEDLNTGKQRNIPSDGLFVEIGHTPNTGIFQNHLLLNDKGEINISARKETNLPGIFAAGDVTASPYKQIIIAVSDGAVAALAANDYINQHTLDK